MNSTPAGRDRNHTLAQNLQIPDFEVSWVGSNPLDGGYCFGSEDGRLIYLSKELKASPPSRPLLNSQEAVNGAAFAGHTIAVSTRIEVVFIEISQWSQQAFRKSLYEGGSHGVISLSSEKFIAPLGYNGLLMMKPTTSRVQPMSILTIKEKNVNFYKAVHLEGNGTSDTIALACRQMGICALQLSIGNETQPDSVLFYNPHNLDAIDTCSLRTQKWPRSIACLGADSSVYLCRDPFAEDPEGFKFPDLAGIPYSIHHYQGHIIVLTSQGITWLFNFASNYLNSDDLEKGFTTATMPLPAVDIAVINDNIVAVLENGVTVFPAASIASQSANSGSGVFLTPKYIHIYSNAHRESSMKSAWSAELLSLAS